MRVSLGRESLSLRRESFSLENDLPFPNRYQTFKPRYDTINIPCEHRDALKANYADLQGLHDATNHRSWQGILVWQGLFRGHCSEASGGGLWTRRRCFPRDSIRCWFVFIFFAYLLRFLSYYYSTSPKSIAQYNNSGWWFTMIMIRTKARRTIVSGLNTKSQSPFWPSTMHYHSWEHSRFN